MEKLKAFFGKAFELFILAFSALLMVVFTFPLVEADYGPGLDSPYMWALNFIWNEGPWNHPGIIFPIGPLGFLKHPLPIGHNLEIALLTYCILRFFFALMLLRLGDLMFPDRRFLHILLGSLMLYFLNVDLVLLGIMLLAFLFHETKPSILWLLLASLIVSISLFIKYQTFLLCTSALFSFIAADLFRKRTAAPLIVNLIFLLSGCLVSGLLLFRSFGALGNYLLSGFHLVSGYSSAMALSTPNNLWMLLAALLAFLVFPFLRRSPYKTWLFLLLILPLFIVWKHAIVREDSTHYAGMLNFFVLVSGLMIFLSEKQDILTFLFPFASLAGLWMNFSLSPDFSGYKTEVAGPAHFFREVVFIRQYKQHSQETSKWNLAPVMLPKEALDRIGKASFDVYPWDLSYAAANELNWKPRSVLQSIAFSSWQDAKGAEDWQKGKGPEYILFQCMPDMYDGNLGSCDGAYLLNDSPQTMETVLRNYEPLQYNASFILLKKREKEILAQHAESGKTQAKWNEWIAVPPSEEDLLRAKVSFPSSFMYSLKKFFYRGSSLWIEYESGEGRRKLYSLNASNAQDGVWINPFVSVAGDSCADLPVAKIRFLCADSAMISGDIQVSWDRMHFSGDSSVSPVPEVLQWFGKKHMMSPVHFQTEAYESALLDWNGCLADSLHPLSRKRSLFIPPGEFSPPIRFDIPETADSLAKGFEVNAEAFVSLPPGAFGNLVVVIMKDSAVIFRSVRKLYPAAHPTRIFLREPCPELHLQGCRLEAYIWNPGTQPIRADDFLCGIRRIDF